MNSGIMRAMLAHLRIARPVADIDRSADLYARGLGLQVLGRFENHGGFDGVMLGQPGGAWHFEFTDSRAHAITPTPTREDLLHRALETAAFHGLIRLAYALAADHHREIAQALAAWRTTLVRLGPPVDPRQAGDHSSIVSALGAVRQRPGMAFQPRSGMTITANMRACAALPGFDAAVAGADAPADAVATSPDEHRVKLAWTALDEWWHRGWPGYAGALPAPRTKP